MTKEIVSSSNLIYGTMGLGGGWDKPHIEKKDIIEAEKAIETALDIGIKYFDHANIYQHGKSEEVFGYYLKNNPSIREKINIQSKVGIVLPNNGNAPQYNLSYDHIVEEVKLSLKRLKTNYLDFLLLHRPDPLMDRTELKKAIDYLFENELIRGIGVSNMNYHQIELIQDYIERPISINQLEMSLLKLDWVNGGVVFNHDDYKNVDFPVGTIEYCMRKGISLQAWGSLAQGLLSGRPLEDNSHDRIVKTRDLVYKLANNRGVSPESIVLAWLMRHPANISPIVGTKNPKRIRAIKDTSNITLTREEWYKLFNSARGHSIP